jgi:hypothetical protein
VPSVSIVRGTDQPAIVVRSVLTKSMSP